MNKKVQLVCILLGWLVVAIAVFGVIRLLTKSTDKGSDETPTEETISMNDVSEEESTETEEKEEAPSNEAIVPQAEILFDYTEQHTVLDYSTEELTQDKFNWCVNYALESFSVYDLVNVDTTNSFYSTVLSYADDGIVHLVIRVVDGNCIINVCSYGDRINPLYSVTLTYEDDTWNVM